MATQFVKTNYKIIKETKYLTFTLLERPKKIKTDIVMVDSKTLGTIGDIRWHSPWRQYCFFPWGNTVWNKTCLEDVYEVIIYLTQKKKDENHGDS